MWNLSKKRSISKISTIVKFSLIAGALALIMFYLNNSVYTNTTNYINAQLSSNTSALANTINREILSGQDDGTLSTREQCLELFSKYINNQDDSFAQSSINGASFVVCDVGDETYYVDYTAVLTAKYHSLVGKIRNAVESLPTNEVTTLNSPAITSRHMIFVCHPIQDSLGNKIGMVASYTYTTNVSGEQYRFMNQFLIMLMAVAGVLVLIITEINEFFKMLSERKKALKTDKTPEIWCCRAIVFLSMVANTLDATISVLITKDMLTAQGVDSTVMFALPTTFSALGMIGGTLLSTVAGQKIQGKRLAVMCLSAAAVLELLIAPVVMVGNFPLFCVLKLVTDFVLSTYERAIYLFPLRTSDEKRRSKANKEINTAVLAANAFGCIIGGYVSTYIGNAYVYVCAAVPLFLCLVLCIKMLPSKTVFSIQNKSTANTSTKAVVKMLLAPHMLLLLLFLPIANEVCFVYKNIMFPLFASEAGLSNASINNVIAFSGVICIALIPAIDEKIKKLDS